LNDAEELRRSDSAVARGGGEPVSISSGPGGHVITYRLANNTQRSLIVFVWVMVLAFISMAYVGIAGWDNFNLIDYPGFTILSLSATYCLAVWFFNRRTITVGDKTFAVRLGPVPFPLPAGHARDIADVRRIGYNVYHAVQIKGNTLYFVRAVFRDGTRADLFTVFNDEAVAARLAGQLRQWVAEKQAARPKIIVPDALPDLSERELVAADRKQRFKVAISVLAAIIGLAGVVALAEFAASLYRPARQAARDAKEYGAFSEQLRSSENYTVAIPARWETGARKPSRFNSGGKERTFYYRLTEGFLFMQEDKTLSVKGADAEYVSGTPCGRGNYFVLAVPKGALTRETPETITLNAPTLHASKFRASIVSGAEGVEWVCFSEQPKPMPTLPPIPVPSFPTPPPRFPTPPPRR
jgi:hypothetical protein